jgi:hypothetical protein
MAWGLFVCLPPSPAQQCNFRLVRLRRTFCHFIVAEGFSLAEAKKEYEASRGEKKNGR